jgi:calcineurin-like phosphoesterase family protein
LNIWFTADWHFFHENIIKYCSRPFSNAKEMNEVLIKNLNFYVQPNDVLYVLGDLGWQNYEEFKALLNQIKCKNKILIIGNHDKTGVTTYHNLGFSAVLESAEISLGKTRLTMSHYPRKSLLDLFFTCKHYVIKMYKRYRSLKQIYCEIKKQIKQYRPLSNQYHICGHVHTAWKIKNKNINVGVDVLDFKPISGKEILRLIDKEQNEKKKNS